MPDVNLKKIIEALLFVSEKPLSTKQILELCPGTELQQVRSAVKELKELYSAEDRGIQIQEIAGGYQFSSHPDCAEYLKKLYKTHRVFRLTAPALETLAIVAYKQPVTRAEIEFIRGVNVDGVVKTLEERDLIKIKGRKEVPGRPLIYGTTDTFLHYFGLKSLQDLPSLEEFTAQNLNSPVLDEAETDNEETGQNQAAPSAVLPEPEDAQSSLNVDSENPEGAEDEMSFEKAGGSYQPEGQDNAEEVIAQNGEEADEQNEHK